MQISPYQGDFQWPCWIQPSRAGKDRRAGIQALSSWILNLYTALPWNIFTAWEWRRVSAHFSLFSICPRLSLKPEFHNAWSQEVLQSSNTLSRCVTGPTQPHEHSHLFMPNIRIISHFSNQKQIRTQLRWLWHVYL